MSNVIDLQALRKALDALERDAQEVVHLKDGGGDGTSGDMEARVKRLEDDSKEMRADLKAIRIDLAEIKGKLSAMPSTWQIVGICAGLIGIVIASGGGLLAVLRALTPPI